MKKVVGILFLIGLTGMIVYLGLLNNKGEDPRIFYNVYLESELIGTIESKESLEKYIDTKGAELKKKFNVEKIYAPTDLEIVKSVSFKKKIDSIEEVYNKINERFCVSKLNIRNSCLIK